MALPSEVIFSLRNSVPASYLSFTSPGSLFRYSDEEGVFGPTAKFAVEEAANGLVHIRSCYHSYYWGIDIRAMVDRASEPSPTVTVVVLRSRANDQFCGPTNMMFTYLSLLIYSATDNEPVEFGVDELVKSRTVHVKSFSRGRVYNLRSTQLISKNVTNTGDQPQDFELTAPCTFTKKYTFTNDVTLPTNLVSEFRSRISLTFQMERSISRENGESLWVTPKMLTLTENMYPETLYDGIFTGEYMYDIEVNICGLEPF